MLAELNLRAALGLGSARLFEVEQQRRMQHAAVNNLAEVQRMLQPHQPQINGLEYALHWQPAETAAGDYYDVMPLSAAFSEVYDGSAGDVWGAMIGDVSGHGAAAAMEAAQFDAILRTYKPNSDLGPAGALGYANRYFFSRQSRQRLMTVLATRYRPDTRELVYANAGHLPLLVRRGNEVTVYGDGDIPIGVLREQQFRNAAKAAELRSLRYQVNPHFLFNTLNSLSALVLTGKAQAAEKMIQMISTFYRRSLAEDTTSDVPLADEISRRCASRCGCAPNMTFPRTWPMR